MWAFLTVWLWELERWGSADLGHWQLHIWVILVIFKARIEWDKNGWEKRTLNEAKLTL